MKTSFSLGRMQRRPSLSVRSSSSAVLGLLIIALSRAVAVSSGTQTMPNFDASRYVEFPFVAPNGALSVRALKCVTGEDEAFIQLVRQRSAEVVFSLPLSNLHAREFDALWSPDSRLVAISFKTGWGNNAKTRLFRVSSNGLSELKVPAWLNIMHFLPPKDSARGLMFRYESVLPIEWRNRRDLVCEITGVGALVDKRADDDDGALPTTGYLSIAYRATLRCIDGNSVDVVNAKRIKRETTP